MTVRITMRGGAVKLPTGIKHTGIRVRRLGSYDMWFMCWDRFDPGEPCFTPDKDRAKQYADAAATEEDVARLQKARPKTKFKAEII